MGNLFSELETTPETVSTDEQPTKKLYRGE